MGSLGSIREELLSKLAIELNGPPTFLLEDNLVSYDLRLGYAKSILCYGSELVG